MNPIESPPCRSWKVAGVSLAGTHHRREGQPNQDACGWVIVDGLLGIAVSDGAGSAPAAELASKIAVRSALCAVLHAHFHGRCLTVQDARASAIFALESSATALAVEAHGLERLRSDLACTLLILIACKEFIVTAHVGDGAVVLASDPDQLITLSAPTNGTYANETDLLGGSGCIDATVTTLALAPPCRVALLSDGIQRLALATPGLMPHPGLFKPLFAFLEKNDESETQTALTALLQSDLVAARSDDDLTLVLASLA